MDKINDKYRELEGTIDQFKREKQLMGSNKDKLLKDIKKKEDQIKQKEREIDNLNSLIKDGTNAQTLLQNQIRELTSQKLKLDANGKRLGDDLTELKNKLQEQTVKTSDVERERNNLDDKIREIGYRLEVLEQEKKKNW